MTSGSASKRSTTRSSPSKPSLPTSTRSGTTSNASSGRGSRASTLTLIHTDLRGGAPEVEDQSVDLVFTSPPYKIGDGWTIELMRALARFLGRVLAPGGRAFVNFGQLREGFGIPLFTFHDIAMHSGLSIGQTIAWVKSIAIDGKQIGHYQPITMRSKSLNYCWEFVFQFYREPEGSVDRLSIGVPFADKTNLQRGDRGRHGDLHCAGDVWFIPYETTGSSKKKKHSYEFPEALVERALLYSDLAPGSTVCDPFAGSGTTCAVATKHGHDSIAIDIDHEAIEKTWIRCAGLGADIVEPGARARRKPRSSSTADEVRPDVFLLR